MNRRFVPLAMVLLLFTFLNSPAVAAIDLQADLNRIVVGINKFDANSASSSSVKTMADVKRIFANNSIILREIGQANSAFKRDLNSARQYISPRDTKESPAFSTLMNLTKGYEEWLRYQNMDQVSSQKCINRAGNSLSSYTVCAIALLPVTAEHERKGRQKLQAAWDAWKKWQVKYGYA